MKDRPFPERCYRLITWISTHTPVDLTHAILNLYAFVGEHKEEDRYLATAFLANMNHVPTAITRE
jgi:hypothetical protein